jgi:hypothetical protein
LCTTFPLPPHLEHFPDPWQAIQAAFSLSFILDILSLTIQTIEWTPRSQPRIESDPINPARGHRTYEYWQSRLSRQNRLPLRSACYFVVKRNSRLSA